MDGAADRGYRPAQTMLDPKRPLDLVAIAFAALLAGLAILQWREARTFGADSVTAQATVVELRTAKKQLLDARADVFATVEFTPEANAGENAEAVRAELPTAIAQLGLEEEGLVGTLIGIRYDPTRPTHLRYGAARGDEGAYILALLALGALFAPFVLRRATLTESGG